MFKNLHWSLKAIVRKPEQSECKVEHWPYKTPDMPAWTLGTGRFNEREDNDNAYMHKTFAEH